MEQEITVGHSPEYDFGTLLRIEPICSACFAFPVLHICI